MEAYPVYTSPADKIRLRGKHHGVRHENDKDSPQMKHGVLQHRTFFVMDQLIKNAMTRHGNERYSHIDFKSFAAQARMKGSIRWKKSAVITSPLIRPMRQHVLTDSDPPRNMMWTRNWEKNR
jgi:hypothetical protein